MGHFPAKSAVSQPICEGGDTHGRKILAKSISDGWSLETLQSVVTHVQGGVADRSEFCPPAAP